MVLSNPFAKAEQALAKTSLILLCVTLAISVLVAMGMPFDNEDLLLALCAGRDTWNGLLGSPDRWSFVTEGRVWVDQSWLSHLIFYLSYVLMGALGPILVKGCLLAGSLVILYHQCRGLGASKELSILAMTCGVLGLAPFLNIRAHDFAMLYFLGLSSALTAPESWGRWRQLMAILIMAIWSNSHGSFMLGFAILGLRFLLDLARSLNVIARWTVSNGEAVQKDLEEAGKADEPDEVANAAKARTRPREGPDPYGWLAALGATVGIMAFANPYGPENLAMPFRQFFGEERTFAWADWLPLIWWPFLWERGLSRPLSVVPYITLVTLTGLLCVAVLFKYGFRGTISLFTHRRSKADLGAQIMICLVILVLTLKFQRLIVFAAPSIVPLLGMFMQAHAESFESRHRNLARPAASRSTHLRYCVLSVVWVLCCSLILYRYVVIPRLPWNPLKPPGYRPLVADLMSYNWLCEGVAEFMKQNKISGRIVSNLDLSDYLLFHRPGIQFFADLRAHSMYKAKTFEAFFLLLNFGHEKPEESLAMLDRFKVSYLVLNTFVDRCSRLISALINTRKWACVYRDRWVFVLARTDSERFGGMIAAGDLSELWYNSPETRIWTQAGLSLAVKGSWSDELRSEVKATLRNSPDPDIYDLIAAAGKGPNNCLTEETATFLEAELRRLAACDFRVAGGARSILASMYTIIDALSADDALCRSDARSAAYTRLRGRLITIMTDVRTRYNPW